MISLPGLLLIPHRFDEAKYILQNFSRHCTKRLDPERFPESWRGEPTYNTVDASLWFIHAVGRYFEYTKDFLLLADLWNTIDSIIDNYLNGTDFGISMDSDYLIRQGPQLTWMDAKIGELAVTPRAGKTCEINALWYNALKTASNLGDSPQAKIFLLMRLLQLG